MTDSEVKQTIVNDYQVSPPRSYVVGGTHHVDIKKTSNKKKKKWPPLISKFTRTQSTLLHCLFSIDPY